MAGLDRPAVDVEGVGAGEGGGAVKSFDAVAGEVRFHVGRDRVGEAAFVAHQVGPVDRQATGVDALACQEPGGVDDLGAAAQDLLRITAPQRARPAIGQVIDDGDPPPR